MRFSIVIPTSHGPDDSLDLLESLSRGLNREEILEVVIVVNGHNSEPQTQAANSSLFDSPKVRVVYEPVGSLLAGRHRGVAETTGDVISFLDDDVIASDGWCDALIDAFRRPELVLAGGPSRPLFEKQPPRWLDQLFFPTAHGGRSCPFMSLVDLGEEPILPVDPNLIWGLNFSIRRSTLLELGGFHPDLLPSAEQMFQGDGETGLTRQIDQRGLTAGYFPGLAVQHRIPATRMTRDYIKNRAFYEGVCEQYAELRERQEGPASSIFLSPRGGLLRSTWRWARRGIPDQIAGLHLHTLITKYRLRGKEYLTHHFQRAPEVREWIQRETYWDWSHPGSVT